MESGAPDDHRTLVDWYADLLGALVTDLRATDPAASCWQMWSGPDGPAFWARRQVHEAAIHRIDLEEVTGRRTPLDPALAADGVDELLVMLPGLLPPTDPATTYQLLATDTSDCWRVVAGPDRTRVTRDPGTDGVLVSGSAADLYAFCWNRRPETTPLVSDRAQWESWSRSVKI